MGREFVDRLPEIIAALPDAIDRALEVGAAEIAQSAKDRAPVRTGRLRDAIHVERKSWANYEVVAGDGEAWYGHLVELGTSHSPAEPFLVPSLEEHRDSVEALVHVRIQAL